MSVSSGRETVEKLGGELALAIEPADSEVSLALQDAFFAEITSRYPSWRPRELPELRG